MKKEPLYKILLALSLSLLLGVHTQAKDAWISDEIEAPLRDSPELNANIIAMLPAGQRITVQEEKDEYVKIKTEGGKEGWLSDYYVLKTISVHAQLGPLKEQLASAESRVKSLEEELNRVQSQNSELASSKAALERTASEVEVRAKSNESSAKKLAEDNELLQKKLSEQSQKMTELAKALDIEKQKASTARADYFSLVKVSENVIDVEKQNRALQQSAVELEQEIQSLKNDNQIMKIQLKERQMVIAALLIFGGGIAGYVLSVAMPPRRRRNSDFSSL